MEIKFLTEPLEKIKTQAMVITVFEEEHESIEVFDTLNEKN
jgi:hypothetical protein